MVEGVKEKRSLKFLVLSGSERAGGNTDLVSQRIIHQIRCLGEEATLLALREYKIEPCGTCGECNFRSYACVVDDDMPFIIGEMNKADAIIYVATVRGFGLGWLMQNFIERAGVGYLRFDRPLVDKVAGVVVTGRRYSHMDVYSQVSCNLLLNRMILVGSGYPAVVHGGRRGEALDDKEGMSSVQSLVIRMCAVAHRLNGSSSLDDFVLPKNERIAG